jgi:hypothetical protein
VCVYSAFVLSCIMNDQVKEDEMGRACSTNGGEEECIEKPQAKVPLGKP